MSARLLLGSLPASARLAYPVILSGVRRSLSKNAIVREVRAKGIPITYNRTLTPLVDALRIEEAVGRSIRTKTATDVMPSLTLPESIRRMETKYSFRYVQHGIDRNGNRVVRNINISTDRDDITREELDEIASKTLDDRNKYDTLQNASLEPDFGMQRSLDNG